ncbi:MAG TPA: YbhB/YbcL family Raf kinase inhibitor-like protein [Gemmatimonadaceae bacterium]
MTLTLTSSAFSEGAAIPTKYTCDGDETSPPLAWSGVPDTALSLALIVDDPDAPDPAAPKQRFVHWVLYNIPPDARGLPEGASGGKLPPGALEGSNDFHKSGYGGPCPPVGRHRYFFTLYALDTTLSSIDKPSRSDLEAAMKGHVLEKTETIGTYQH